MRDDAASPPDSSTAAGRTHPGTPCWLDESGGGSSCITMPVLRHTIKRARCEGVRACVHMSTVWLGDRLDQAGLVTV